MILHSNCIDNDEYLDVHDKLEDEVDAQIKKRYNNKIK